MEKDYWHKKWHTQDIAWHQKSVNPFLQKFIDRLNLQAGNAILVPLCGKSRDMLWLADQGYRVIGIELSPIACDEFFNEMNVTPEKTQEGPFTKYQFQQIEIYCGDIFALTKMTLPAIQAIYDCRALVALPDDTRTAYVNHLFSCLGDDMRILLMTIESPGIVQGPPFSVNAQEVQRLYGEHSHIQLLSCVTNDAIPDHLIAKGYREFIECAYVIEPKI